MKQIPLGGGGPAVPAVVVGCMRLGELDRQSLNRFIHVALEQGANYFDHADIYGRDIGPGACEEHFGAAVRDDPSIRREDLIIQSKCGIRRSCRLLPGRRRAPVWPRSRGPAISD